MSAGTTFWFIRHGESISNANLPTRHPAASEVTAKGEWEAAQTARAFPQAPELIVVSPFIRAKQTAVPTQRRFPHTPTVEWPIHEFTYLHPERYNGTTGSQRGPWAQAYWERSDPFEEENGGGESFAAMMARVQEMRRRLQQIEAPFVALFSHGLFLRAFIWMHLTGVTQPSADAMFGYRSFVWGVRFPNCAIMSATLHEGRLTLGTISTAHIPPYPGS
jgi:probable phosphoglycerate mutase